MPSRQQVKKKWKKQDGEGNRTLPESWSPADPPGSSGVQCVLQSLLIPEPGQWAYTHTSITVSYCPWGFETSVVGCNISPRTTGKTVLITKDRLWRVALPPWVSAQGTRGYNLQWSGEEHWLVSSWCCNRLLKMQLK